MKNFCMAILLIGALLAGCGGSDDKSTAPADGDVGALSKVLVESMKRAFLASLISDTTSVPGMRGTVEIRGDSWTFVGYSPDGELTIDGMLVVEQAKYPDIPARGTLQLQGSQQGTLVVDMLVKVKGLEVAATGTFELNGQTYDVAQLLGAGSGSG